MDKPTAPTVHLGGTSGEELLENINKARTALALALDAIAATAPHGRDYPATVKDAAYYLPGQATPGFTQALLQHGARVDKLQQVHDELSVVGRAIADQVFSRGWSRSDRSGS